MTMEPLALTDSWCWSPLNGEAFGEFGLLEQRRRVSFNEEDNRVFYLDERPYDQETKHLLWYSSSDFQYFRSTMWATSQALLLSAPHEVASFWSQALTDSYERKAATTTTAQHPQPQQQLSHVYTQADDLVGLEFYVLNESCQADLRARKSAINGALRMTRRTSARSSCKAHHLSALSRRLSKTAQRFAHEIASAQSEALAWTI